MNATTNRLSASVPLTCLWVMFAALPLFAQPPAEQAEPIFRSDTTLATVTFHVIRDKRYVDDLRPEDIVLLEDGIPRKVSFFQGGRSRQQAPQVDIAVLFDISGSVVDEGLLDLTTWNSSFIKALPGASLAVYGFAGNLLRFCSPTRDPQVLEAAFNSVLKTSKSGPKVKPVAIKLSLPPKRKPDSGGGTWIYEAVIGAVHDLAERPGTPTRVIVIFSDGFPTTSSVPEDAAKVARDAGITVYPVALGHWRLVQRSREIMSTVNGGQPNESTQRRLNAIHAQEQEIMDFASLGELTGGRSFDPPFMNSDILKRITGGLVGSIMTEYVAGFTPDATAGAPAKHKLTVKLASKEIGKLTGGSRIILH